MNKSDDFDEVQDISSMSVGGVVSCAGAGHGLSQDVPAHQEGPTGELMDLSMNASHWYHFK